jgi:hypothetical protein
MLIAIANWSNYTMDPIGAAASLITLIALAVKTCKVVNKLARTYREVSAELGSLKCQMLLREYVHEAVTLNELSLSEAELTTLDIFLRETTPIFTSIENHFGHLLKRTREGKRLK